jgi:hypothetical protein
MCAIPEIYNETAIRSQFTVKRNSVQDQIKTAITLTPNEDNAVLGHIKRAYHDYYEKCQQAA